MPFEVFLGFFEVFLEFADLVIYISYIGVKLTISFALHVLMALRVNFYSLNGSHGCHLSGNHIVDLMHDVFVVFLVGFLEFFKLLEGATV